MSLHAASVPVFLHYLGQMQGLVGNGDLTARIADSFPAGQQFATAVGFSLRTSCALAGQDVPPLQGPVDAAGLLVRIGGAAARLRALDPADFRADRIIRHQAGQANLAQSAADFLHLYGMPNFFFHLTMGYAALRAAGAVVGKADFDGFHTYAAGFRFADAPDPAAGGGNP